MTKTLKEFQDFIAKGNVLDMAVGVIVGGAFGKIVTSLVTDILMPAIGLITGGVDFSSLYLNLSGRTFATLKEAEAAGAAIIKYGLFINNVINFMIMAFCIFMVVKLVTKLQKTTSTIVTKTPVAK